MMDFWRDKCDMKSTSHDRQLNKSNQGLDSHTFTRLDGKFQLQKYPMLGATETNNGEYGNRCEDINCHGN